MMGKVSSIGLKVGHFTTKQSRGTKLGARRGTVICPGQNNDTKVFTAFYLRDDKMRTDMGDKGKMVFAAWLKSKTSRQKGFLLFNH